MLQKKQVMIIQLESTLTRSIDLFDRVFPEKENEAVVRHSVKGFDSEAKQLKVKCRPWKEMVKK